MTSSWPHVLLQASEEMVRGYVQWRKEWDVENIEDVVWPPLLPVNGTFTGFHGLDKVCELDWGHGQRSQAS